MKKEKKRQIIQEITENLKGFNSIIFTDYRGLSTREITELRQSLKEDGYYFKVVKNNLAKIAARNAQADELENLFEGPTAITYGQEDYIKLSKILSDFSKKFPKLSIKGGLIEGKINDGIFIKKLAQLPSKEVLISKLATTLEQPMFKFHYILYSILQKFMFVLGEITRKKANSLEIKKGG